MISWKLVQRAKQIIENERGTIHKPWGGRIAICLIYPNHYAVGMSNLGFQTVYRCLNAEDDVVCERAFLPDPEDFHEYRETQTPLLSLESQKPLSDFDILAFSLSFENDFINILTLLDLARVPKESHLRGKGSPLVMAGGVSVFLNPEPLSDFFDFFVLGEAEEVLTEILQVIRATLAAGGKTSKEDLLRRLGAVEGIYVPAFYHVTYKADGKMEAMVAESGFPRQIKRRWVKDLDPVPTQSVLFTADTEFKELALVEVNRGCPRGCRFCGACFVYYPFRNRSLPVLESLISEALTREPRIGLAGTAVSDYAQLVPLCQKILAERGGFSLSSLRVDAISPALAQCLNQSDVHTVAIAPEAASERLRRILKKGYQEEEILEAVETLVENGVSQIKSYFMIGLPSETDEDVRTIVHLARRIQHQVVSNPKTQKRKWKLVLSITPFVPKPATPFQWAPLDRVGELKRKLKTIQGELKGEKQIHMIHDLPKWAYVQALLSRGDRRVGKILLEAHRRQGNWSRAFQESSLNPDFFVHRMRDLDEVFPWDFIDHGIPKEELKEEYLKAMKEADIKIVS